MATPPSKAKHRSNCNKRPCPPERARGPTGVTAELGAACRLPSLEENIEHVQVAVIRIEWCEEAVARVSVYCRNHDLFMDPRSRIIAHARRSPRNHKAQTDCPFPIPRPLRNKKNNPLRRFAVLAKIPARLSVVLSKTKRLGTH